MIAPNTALQFPKAEALCRIKKPLDWNQENRGLMVEACREMALFHSQACPAIGKLYNRRMFDPNSIKNEDSLAAIPPLGVWAMKTFFMTSLPDDQAILKLTSSGTKGQKTQIWFDAGSLDRAQAMMESLWDQEGLISPHPANYLMFVYDPDQAQDLGIAFSCKNEARFAPAAEMFFAIKKNAKGAWEMAIERVLEKLGAFAKDGKPLRITGMPAFIHEALEKAASLNLRLQMPPSSFVFTGGGWKAAEDKSVTREKFRLMIQKYLGIPPAYCRILIRDPQTMQVLGPGKTGLLELISPFNAMMPNLAVLSSDLGMTDPDACPCGRASPAFTLTGRGGHAKAKGCALTASDIVQRT
ncbi:MAG: hypothetical protein HY747_02560 [Elusimicrobia bacterium]|nr:hypothetical protein [Elusimicrobiota bacterium]